MPEDDIDHVFAKEKLCEEYKKSTVVGRYFDAGYPALGPQQPQQGASSQMPLAQTAAPRRESHRSPSSDSTTMPGLAWQSMP